MFTTSQFLQIHNLRQVILQKNIVMILLHRFTIIRLDEFFPWFFSRIRIKNIFLNTYSPLFNCREVNYQIFYFFEPTSMNQHSSPFTETLEISTPSQLLPILPPDTHTKNINSKQVKDKPHCTIRNFSNFFLENKHVFKDKESKIPPNTRMCHFDQP